MAKKRPRTESTIYQIRIKGHLDTQWAAWFGGMEVVPEANGITSLTGPVVDQAALYGLLRTVRDLGIPLLSVTCLGPGDSIPPDAEDRLDSSA